MNPDNVKLSEPCDHVDINVHVSDINAVDCINFVPLT